MQGLSAQRVVDQMVAELREWRRMKARQVAYVALARAILGDELDSAYSAAQLDHDLRYAVAA